MKDDRLISLNAAIDAMMKLQTEDIEAYGASIPEGFDGDRAVAALKALPPAQPDHIGEVTEMVGDNISRQAAIDALEKVADMFPWRVPGNRDTYDRYNEAWNDAIGRAEMEIENMPSAQPGWIPCSKEMPPKNGRYLVTEKDAFEDIKVRFRYWNTECLWSGWSGDQMDEVLAWCELPKPWEGGQS